MFFSNLRNVGRKHQVFALGVFPEGIFVECQVGA